MSIGEKECSQKFTTLYDVGGWYVLFILWGIGFLAGIVIDYFWNFLVLYATLRWKQIIIPLRKKFIYCIIVTAFGLLIDWLYYELTWGTLVIGNFHISAAFSPAGIQPLLEVSTILIPAFIIGVANFCVSKMYFRLTFKQALLLAIVMGIFTAPWLIVTFVLLHW
jgi:hypothetical protein